MKASFIARLGSGSASRSVYGEVVSWGDNNVFPGTSDLFASDISLQIHPVFKSFKNSILIIDSGQKKVSSSLGHSLMKGHPFATTRFSQANANFQKLAVILKNGDVEGFIEVVENEALTLHSMMMTSKPWFILMSPETIKVLSLIREYREETGVPVCFTVDAGPNIHLLYPREYSEKVSDFINSLITEEFVVQNVIFDDVGKGPLKVI
jgi:diphosphomevalonate decarboxylase